MVAEDALRWKGVYNEGTRAEFLQSIRERIKNKHLAVIGYKGNPSRYHGDKRDISFYDMAGDLVDLEIVDIKFGEPRENKWSEEHPCEYCGGTGVVSEPSIDIRINIDSPCDSCDDGIETTVFDAWKINILWIERQTFLFSREALKACFREDARRRLEQTWQYNPNSGRKLLEINSPQMMSSAVENPPAINV